jgi:hypothetical protein
MVPKTEQLHYIESRSFVQSLLNKHKTLVHIDEGFFVNMDEMGKRGKIKSKEINYIKIILRKTRI